MDGGDVSVDASEALRGTTLEITVRVNRSLRFRLGCWLLNVAYWLLGAEQVRFVQPPEDVAR